MRWTGYAVRLDRQKICASFSRKPWKLKKTFLKAQV